MSPGRGILTLAGALGLLFPWPAGSAAPQSPGALPDSLPTYEIREPVEVTTTEQTLREKLRRIEVLFAGEATGREKAAAVRRVRGSPG